MHRIARARGLLSAATRLSAARSVAAASSSRFIAQFAERASIKSPSLHQPRSAVHFPPLIHYDFLSASRAAPVRRLHALPPALSTPPPAPAAPDPHGGSKWEHFKDEMRRRATFPATLPHHPPPPLTSPPLITAPSLAHTCIRYWTGLKLLKAEFKIAWKIVRRLLHGDTLTRREKQQLSRSAGDLLKLVPFIVIVIGTDTAKYKRKPVILILRSPVHGARAARAALPVPQHVALHLHVAAQARREPPGLVPRPHLLTQTPSPSSPSRLSPHPHPQKKLRARIEVAKFLQKALDDMAESAKVSGARGGGSAVVTYSALLMALTRAARHPRRPKTRTWRRNSPS
jgi:hypothetical protein